MTIDTKKTVLIIEDNEDNMVLISMLLHEAGYTSIWAETGLMGVEMAQKLNPDFILLDIQLPDIDGTEVLKKIRSSETDTTKIPIIAVTSYAMSGDREKLLAAGCDGYLEKPIDPLRVINQIVSILKEDK